ncbi:TraR/DksA family transcriptional regulator [Halopseudomonas pelagia]|uniref:TraR/DksA family transcriptional regulator n=1 Tax=Halopseudomonas pelagia TaxID=553151 RepID=UPI003C6DA3CE
MSDGRQRLRQALAHIDDDDYGICIECGEPIARGRLKIDPVASYCIGCATALRNDVLCRVEMHVMNNGAAS